MKECKRQFQECKKRLPNRPPDEIDFGLGFSAGLRWMKQIMIDNAEQETLTFADIEKELQ